MRAAMTQRRRWRRTRGVAMSEFLVGLPMIIVLWAGVDYFRGTQNNIATLYGGSLEYRF